ncbi:MAG: DNA polymerase III subunit gamma/tau [Patescibacteria group bacterium]|nr:DNA polymerase III subunit gamma/tau [Patescibacteria group bacterium]
MQKIALYRKYRPEKFSEIYGQDHITRVLSNALKENMVSHAYLFSGPRGTGKTSVARILAKALNCESRTGSSACGKCKSCRAIKENATLDLIEIDAASNRGIDEIRDLREKIKFAPSESSYKIFIIDEVHMLTKEAFNALLKTLEEPPSHAFFILATTEINRVPTTIISRCQRHDFKRIKLKDIVTRLHFITEKEKIKTSDDALELIAEASEGGLRDALSILDQLSSTGLREISSKDIVEIIGLAPHKEVFGFIKSLISGNIKKTLKTVNRLAKSGFDLVIFTRAIQEEVSKIIIAKLVGIDEVEGTAEQLEDIAQISATVETSKLSALSRGLSELQKNFRSGIDPEFALSIFVIDTSESEGASTSQEIKSEKIEVPTKEVKKKDLPIKDKRTNGQWHHFLLEVKAKNNTLHAFLRVANPLFTDNDLCLNFPYKFHKEKLEESKNRIIVEDIVEKVYGKRYQVRCLLNENLGRGSLPQSSDEAVSILGGEVVVND